MRTRSRAGQPVYLDNQATTPIDPRVVDAMLPFLTEQFGNPHSIQHTVGQSVAEAVETARAQVASLIGAEPREIVFTSGATESNNLAIKGAAHFARRYKALDHVVTAATEHKCVLESCRRLEDEDFSVTVLPVGPSGHVDFDVLEDAIIDRTALVSVMAAQNEVGVLAPMEEIGDITRARGILFHTDAAQAIGKVPLDVNASKIDLLSISSHKVYGPKGIGALYVRRRPRARIEPLIDGGGQERGLRSGTLSPALCVGLGTACALAEAEMAEEADRLAGLRGRLLGRLRAVIPDLFVNGDLERRLPGNLNVGVPGLDSEALIADLADTVCLSSGSACTSASVEPSYVLRAMGLPETLAGASLRIGLGRFTTADEVDKAADAMAAAIRAQRGVEVAGAAE